ncbi:unnamed protein product [Sphagnum troendelagicum]
MEVSISAMCEHLRVPTCLVSCGFVISRDVQHHLQLSMAEDDLVTFHPTAGVVFYGLMVFFQRTSGALLSLLEKEERLWNNVVLNPKP